MGVWGAGLYDNDAGQDVRELCGEVYPLLGAEEGTKAILLRYGSCDEAAFWLALADWQWQHGILADAVREKALALLDSDEAQQDPDRETRSRHLETLRRQLLSPQGPVRIPPLRLARPLHQPGQILLIHTCEADPPGKSDVWVCPETSVDIFPRDTARQLSARLEPALEAYDRYIALLCTGIEEQPYSEFAPEVFDRYSVYAVYDYLGREAPTLDTLRQTGFLSNATFLIPHSITRREGANWYYRLTLPHVSLRAGKNPDVRSFHTLFCPEEAERFDRLFRRKDYPQNAVACCSFGEVFYDFFPRKLQLAAAGIPYDDLLSPDVKNPPLWTPGDPVPMTPDELLEALGRLGL